MTVSTATDRASYATNGATNGFAVPFYFLDDTHLLVTYVVDDAETVLVLNSGYTVSGAGSEEGGAILTTVTYPSGGFVVIKRNVPLVQLTAYPQNTPFPSDSHERALDYLTMVDQQQQEVLDRALTVPDIGSAIDASLPAPTAGQLIGWNLDGDGFRNVDPTGSGDLTLRSDVAATDRTGGADIVGYKAAGTGAVAQTVQAKLDHFIHVADYGAVGDGTTDDAAAIQAAINYAETVNGGVVRFDAKTYAIGSTLLVSVNNVMLLGMGANMPVDGGTGAQFGTKLLWTGAASGTMVNFETPVGTGNAKRSGGGMEDIQLHGNASAGIGLRVCSWAKADFLRLHVVDVTTAAYRITCWSTTQLGDAADTQYVKLDRCSWTLIASAAVQSAEGIVMTSEAPGTSTADTSLCRAIDCVGESYNGAGLHIIDADNNYFENVRCSIVAPGTGKSILLDGTYSNVFFGCPIGNSVQIKGVPSGAIRASTLNVFFGSDDANSTGAPTVDADCTFQWHGTKYGWQGLISAPACFGGTRTGAQAQAANMSNETLRVSNSNTNHVRFTDGTNEWALRIDGSGNLQFLKIAGSGTVLMPGAAFSTHADASITGIMTVTDSTGTARKLAVIA